MRVIQLVAYLFQKYRQQSVFLISMFICCSGVVSAAEPVSTGVFDNKALSQHDVVSYYLNEKEIKGSTKFVHRWNDADWYFISAEQRDLFAAKPEKYIPAYNGFCSNALTLDEGLISTSGKVWHIFEGNLHLFFAERGLKRWLSEDYKTLKAVADRAWQAELALLR